MDDEKVEPVKLSGLKPIRGSLTERKAAPVPSFISKMNCLNLILTDVRFHSGDYVKYPSLVTW